MRRFLVLFAVALGAFSVPAFAQAGRTASIVAVVNDDAVSASDLADRTKLLLASSGLTDTPEVRAKLRPQIINSLVEERLMMQEASRDKIVISKQDADNGFATVAKQNNMTADQFAGILAHQGIPRRTLEDQITAQIAWSRVIEQKIRPTVDVSDADIDIEMKKLQTSIGQTRYQVSEIFLPVETPKDEPQTRALAERLVSEMRQGHAPFQRVAAQFSQAPGASQGGDIGWIEPGQLDPALDKALEKMAEGTLSDPVRASDGYHILLLRKKSTTTADNLPSREAIREKIGMERLDRAQRSFLLNLKAKAFIEQRV